MLVSFLSALRHICSNMYRSFKMVLILVLNMSLVDGISPAVGCGYLWYEFNGSCYRMYQRSNTFEEARSFCQNDGADLVVIANEEENQFLKELFYLQEDLQSPETIWHAFIGLTDMAKEGTHVWVDGTPLSYSNWVAGDPNDSDGTNDIVEIVGPYIPSNYGRWVDSSTIKTSETYICERKYRQKTGITVSE
ncbi:hypothetical protein LSH36_994g01031 [Paralvinella palmiformis]|uniref:C-type lectin domain-containing protein n=1 Tax=Paralvinella palmiformis TaxID=53620 RepID=A0AAD9MT78_9ANNE|nr:hypothetical protein LSH36_994g01031 [Paralvinella palmiformis]